MYSRQLRSVPCSLVLGLGLCKKHASLTWVVFCQAEGERERCEVETIAGVAVFPIPCAGNMLQGQTHGGSTDALHPFSVFSVSWAVGYAGACRKCGRSPAFYLAGVLRACVQITAKSLDYLRPHEWKFGERGRGRRLLRNQNTFIYCSPERPLGKVAQSRREK